MGLPWTLKESRLTWKKKKENDQISVMGSQRMKRHNWMISEREV
jgi:hypothetical protein